MSPAAENITLQFPRASVEGMLALSDSLTQRMHELLERNTDGLLSPAELEEPQTLVRISQFGQLLAMSLDGNSAS